jgi:hypothetical protein
MKSTKFGVNFVALILQCSYLFQAIKKAFRPSKRWGPKSNKAKQEWQLFSEEQKAQMKGASTSSKVLHTMLGVTRRRPSSVASSS